MGFLMLFVGVKPCFLRAGPACLLNLHDNNNSGSEKPGQSNTLLTMCCGGWCCGWSFCYVSLIAGPFLPQFPHGAFHGSRIMFIVSL